MNNLQHKHQHLVNVFFFLSSCSFLHFYISLAEITQIHLVFFHTFNRDFDVFLRKYSVRQELQVHQLQEDFMQSWVSTSEENSCRNGNSFFSAAVPFLLENTLESFATGTLLGTLSKYTKKG